ncbi:MAG: hypothetical protein IPP45_13380 [Sphingomonadales bacterium]|nr:hypothetical protein [Sphingomonadales bacterium]
MPLALAAAVIALTRWQMLGFWQSALAIACCAAAAPLFDRSLIRDITQLGHTRLRSEADRLTSDV